MGYKLAVSPVGQVAVHSFPVLTMLEQSLDESCLLVFRVPPVILDSRRFSDLMVIFIDMAALLQLIKLIKQVDVICNQILGL